MKNLILICFTVAISISTTTAFSQKVVFLCGDDEYRSEESMPMLAKMIKRDYGFETVVGFSVDEKGHINPNVQSSITMTEELADADLLVMFLRYRKPSEKAFANILNYFHSGKPIVAFRTSTHAFRFEPERGRYEWGWQNDPKQIHSLAGGDHMRELVGQKWLTHHGHFDDGKKPLTSITIKGENSCHPILRGIETFETYSWLYHVEGGGDTVGGEPSFLLEGTSLKSKHKQKGNADRYPTTGPVAWTKTHPDQYKKKGRIFTTTLGHPYDFKLAPMRRLAIQGILWALDKDELIPKKGVNTKIVGTYEPNNSGVSDTSFKTGLTPEAVMKSKN